MLRDEAEKPKAEVYSKTSVPISFAGSGPGEVRHIMLLLFNSDDVKYRVLLPFEVIQRCCAARDMNDGPCKEPNRPLLAAKSQKRDTFARNRTLIDIKVLLKFVCYTLTVTPPPTLGLVPA